MAAASRLVVREMEIAEVGIRIGYFHDSSDEHLLKLGVDRTSLPSKEIWHATYVEDYARPLEDREGISLIWKLDDRVVGFSSSDRIRFGEEAFMHLHIVSQDLRRQGFGTQFVRESTRIYFQLLRLKRLYCEPNAFNIAPNRTLQRAGFQYLFTHEAQPSPINFYQALTRWVMERPVDI